MPARPGSCASPIRFLRMPDGAQLAEAAQVAVLCKVRRAAGVRANSPIEVLLAEADLYVARVAGTVAELTVKLGPRFEIPTILLPDEADGHVLVASGDDFAVWSRPLAPE